MYLFKFEAIAIRLGKEKYLPLPLIFCLTNCYLRHLDNKKDRSEFSVKFILEPASMTDILTLDPTYKTDTLTCPVIENNLSKLY